MNLNEYQDKATEFAQYAGYLYPFLALAEEAGEFLGLAAKVERGDDMIARFGSLEKLTEAFKKEAGDVLWQLSQCCRELDLTLEDVAQANIQKLEDRLARDVIKGAGDDR